MERQIQSYRFFQDLQRLPFVDEIWLFGSRARGDALDRSDIDLAIVCPNATQDDWYKVLEIPEDSDTLLKIDLVRFDQLANDDPLRNNILKFKQVLYKKQKPI